MSEAHLKKAKVIFVLGGPGSGKGTQCDKLVEKYHYNHLSSGDLLREECASGSKRGKELEEIMKRGELVSLDTVLQLLRDAMIKCVDKNCYFLIDGYPRELDQGVRFEREICPCMCVISFDVDEKVMTQRLLNRGKTSGRADDNEETIVKRLKTFNDMTKPVLDYYEKQHKLIRIDASGSIDDIFKVVDEKLKQFQK
jgi:adenylate kinase